MIAARDAGDDAARLVYADWLLEQGDPRGELIRLQCELAGCALRDPRRPAIRGRERELLATVKPAITAEVAGQVERLVIRRGMIEAVTLRAPQLARHGEALLAAHPIRELRVLVDGARQYPGLVRHDLLARVPAVELSGRVKPSGALRTGDPRVFAGTRLFAATERLAFTDIDVDGDPWAELLPRLHAPRLRALALESVALGEAGLDALASPHALPALERLRLGNPAPQHHPLGRKLLELARRPGLRALELSHCVLDDDELAVAVGFLAERAGGLRELALSWCGAADATVSMLAEVLAVRPLDRLELEGSQLSVAALCRLIRAPGLADLGELVINPYLTRDDELDAIADALLAIRGPTRIRWFWGARLGLPRGGRVLAHVDVVRDSADGSIDLIDPRT